MKAVINATLVMRDHFIPDAILLIDNGKIVDFGEMRRLKAPKDCEIIDAEGLYVGPGFVDLTRAELPPVLLPQALSSHSR